VRECADSQIRALASSGARVHGDLAELTPVAVRGIDPDAVPEAEIAAAAVSGLAGLLVELARNDPDSAPKY
jgi:hypothetical protein